MVPEQVPARGYFRSKFGPQVLEAVPTVPRASSGLLDKAPTESAVAPNYHVALEPAYLLPSAPGLTAMAEGH